MVLFALFFVGGMAGSTSGGVKALRVMLLLKAVGNELPEVSLSVVPGSGVAGCRNLS